MTDPFGHFPLPTNHKPSLEEGTRTVDITLLSKTLELLNRSIPVFQTDDENPHTKDHFKAKANELRIAYATIYDHPSAVSEKSTTPDDTTPVDLKLFIPVWHTIEDMARGTFVLDNVETAIKSLKALTGISLSKAPRPAQPPLYDYDGVAYLTNRIANHRTRTHNALPPIPVSREILHHVITALRNPDNNPFPSEDYNGATLAEQFERYEEMPAAQQRELPDAAPVNRVLFDLILRLLNTRLNPQSDIDGAIFAIQSLPGMSEDRVREESPSIAPPSENRGNPAIDNLHQPRIPSMLSQILPQIPVPRAMLRAAIPILQNSIISASSDIRIERNDYLNFAEPFERYEQMHAAQQPEPLDTVPVYLVRFNALKRLLNNRYNSRHEIEEMLLSIQSLPGMGEDPPAREEGPSPASFPRQHPQVVPAAVSAQPVAAPIEAAPLQPQAAPLQPQAAPQPPRMNAFQRFGARLSACCAGLFRRRPAADTPPAAANLQQQLERIQRDADRIERNLLQQPLERIEENPVREEGPSPASSPRQHPPAVPAADNPPAAANLQQQIERVERNLTRIARMDRDQRDPSPGWRERSRDSQLSRSGPVTQK